MKQPDVRLCNRRGFLGLALPACAVTCFALEGAPVVARERSVSGQAPVQPSGHPFDAELPRTLTYRQLLTARFSNVISLAQFMTKSLGHDKTIELLKAYATTRSQQSARSATERAGGHDFTALKQLFTPGAPGFKNTLLFEVVESTDAIHELKVTECLWARTWLDAGAGEQGFAAVCFGDYAFAKAFDPRLEMVRDKTLMQGDAFCNHRYLWKA